MKRRQSLTDSREPPGKSSAVRPVQRLRRPTALTVTVSLWLRGLRVGAFSLPPTRRCTLIDLVFEHRLRLGFGLAHRGVEHLAEPAALADLRSHRWMTHLPGRSHSTHPRHGFPPGRSSGRLELSRVAKYLTEQRVRQAEIHDEMGCVHGLLDDAGTPEQQPFGDR